MPLPFLNTLIVILSKVGSVNWQNLSKTATYLNWWRNQTGLYDVLEHSSTLELHDQDGQDATYDKQQTVRFLQDNIIAYQDKAWGDGNIFTSYQCSPGKPVDWYREGTFYHVLISLRETKQRGDVETFAIERKIKNGFRGEVEEWQTDIDHRTRRLSISIIFPAHRYPKDVTLLLHNAKTSRRLGQSHFRTLPAGRLQVVWETRRAKTFESYIMRWRW